MADSLKRTTKPSPPKVPEAPDASSIEKNDSEVHSNSEAVLPSENIEVIQLPTVNDSVSDGIVEGEQILGDDNTNQIDSTIFLPNEDG